jgi:hypothetical protein
MSPLENDQSKEVFGFSILAIVELVPEDTLPLPHNYPTLYAN